MIPDRPSRLDRRARAIRIARPVLTAVAGLGVVGALAACSAAGAETGGATYADGTYAADGSYASPGGPESIQVSLTLQDNIVTAVSVTPEATSGNAKQYQTAFASGIAEEVIGVDINDLAVDKVSGSSLTSIGFNEAVEAIKADAAT
jgi:uncharacterized protein with FMN-binding domain